MKKIKYDYELKDKKFEKCLKQNMQLKIDIDQRILRKNTNLANKICQDFNVRNYILRNGIVSLLSSCVGFLDYECTSEDRNYYNVLEMIELIQLSSEDYEPTILDLLFEELAGENPNHFAIRQYNIFKILPYKYKAKVVFMTTFYLNKMFILNRIKE